MKTNSYSDLLKIINEHPHSRKSLKLRKFINTQISQYRIDAEASKGSAKTYWHKEANKLEENLKDAIAGLCKV